MAWQEWDLDPWLLRCVPVQGVHLVGLEGHDPSEPSDAWIWFVSRHGEDEWFAVGIADAFDLSHVDGVAAAVHAGAAQIDCMISYCGMPWIMLEDHYVSFAQEQTAMQAALWKDPTRMKALLSMGRSEIEHMRQLEEEESARDLDAPSNN